MLAVATGLFAPPSAGGVLGIEPLDALAQPVAFEIERQVQAGRTLRVVRVKGDPAASDCRKKPYAAVAQIETTVIPGSADWNVDAGLLLLDCAGWNVEEWHEFASLDHPPAAADAYKLGVDLVLRLQTWMYAEPALSHNLFASGLAFQSSSTPSYFYTLFKTSDGNLRTYVRPAGPAYEAGLRTNDVVEKIDGRWWWEYGTYQSQQRAYDGKPHAFDVKRGAATLRVVLGTAFTVESSTKSTK